MISPTEILTAYAALAEAMQRHDPMMLVMARKRLASAFDAARIHAWLEGAQSLVGQPPVKAHTSAAAIDAILSAQPWLRPYLSQLQNSPAGANHARAAEVDIRRKMLLKTVSIIREGGSVAEAREAAPEGVRKSYAETAFRTISAGAYARGQVRAAANPMLRGLISGFRYEATMDGDTRPNHAAANQFVAPVESPVWQYLTPPLGFNCRCVLTPVSTAEARRLFGRDDIPAAPIPAGAGADPGFNPREIW